jgi:TonB family protein
MPEPLLFALPGSPQTSRLRPFLLSMGIHAAVIGLAISSRGTQPFTGAPPAPAAQQTNSRRKIVWFTAPMRLPTVAPPEADEEQTNQPNQTQTSQNIAATAKQPESRRQMVLQAPPELRLKSDVVSPNVLAFNPPAPSPPASKIPSVPPAAAPVRPRALPELEEPQVTAEAHTPALPLRPTQVPPPRFQLPQQPAASPKPSALAFSAPQIAVPAASDGLLARLESKLSIERPKFVLPVRSAAEGRSRGRSPILAPAPQIALRPVQDQTLARLVPETAASPPQFVMPNKKRVPVPSGALPLAGSPIPRVPVRAATDNSLARIQPNTAPDMPKLALPQKPAAAGGAAGKILTPGPVPSVSAIPPAPATVIVGLDPAAAAPPPPPGNRSARFSAGPDAAGREDSPTLSASAKAEFHVPNLSIRSGPASPAAAGSGPPLAADRAAFRRQLMALATSPQPLSDRLRPPPDTAGPPILHGSTVYTMAIDMPNVTSYDGSWTLRFTELGGSSPDDEITAPLAMHKVDPKYIASAAAEKIEGNVLLYAVIQRDGHVSQVRLVQGVDERLDSSAMAAFSKWVFQPATKNGQPIDLEAVVQIPFRTGPHRRN